ncbi:MAG: hypothetical protein ACJ798_12510 [Phenylobacterium sp.]
MSLGMTAFEGRTEDLEPIGVARRAALLLWERLRVIWPYVLALAIVESAVRTVAWRYGFAMGEGYEFHGGESLADFGRHGAWLCARALADGLVLGMLLRALIGYGAPAWRPDRGLLGFTAIYLAASAAPLALFAPTVLAWEVRGDIPLVVATALGGVCALVALCYFYLRLLIWPAGVAVQDPQMSAGRAWNAMMGARIAWLFAGILLMLPLIFGAALAADIALGIYGLHSPVAGPWGAPMHALGSVLWLAVTATVYRLRAGLEE